MKSRKSALLTAALLSMLAISGTALAARGGGSGHSGGHGGVHSGHGGFNGGHGGFRGGHGFGFGGAFIGGAFVAGALLAPWYYPWPYYYPGPYYSSYPSVVEIATSAPTVYSEQPFTAQPAAPDAGSWWYYCNESRAYYPYVRECPSPWQRVAPTPPGSR